MAKLKAHFSLLTVLLTIILTFGTGYAEQKQNSLSGENIHYEQAFENSDSESEFLPDASEIDGILQTITEEDMTIRGAGDELPVVFQKYLERFKKPYQHFGTAVEEYKELEFQKYRRVIRFNRQVTPEELKRMRLYFVDTNLVDNGVHYSLSGELNSSGNYVTLLTGEPSKEPIPNKPYLFIANSPDFKKVYTKLMIVKENPNEKPKPGETDSSRFTINSDGEITDFKHTEGQSNSSFETIVVPEVIDGVTVRSIGLSAFKPEKNLEAYTLREIHLPGTIEEIKDNAFESNEMLSKVSFGENSKLKRIGNNAFYHCWIENDLILPDGLLEIGDEAFSTNRIGRLVMNSSLQEIGNSAFADNRIHELDFTGTKVTHIRKRTFIDNYITNLVLSPDIKIINANAFSNQKYPYNPPDGNKLLDLTYVEEIGSRAFDGWNIKGGTVKFGENLNFLGSYAFYDTGISFVEGLEHSKIEVLNEDVFSECDLTELHLPRTVKHVEEEAIFNNMNFKKLIAPNKIRIHKMAVAYYDKEKRNNFPLEYELVLY